MKLHNWWMVWISSRRWRRAHRKHKRQMVKRYHDIPNAKQIIDSLDMSKAQSDDVLRRVKAALREAEGK